MNAEEITGVYDELSKMFVDVQAEAQRGLPYVRERLVLCRAMQDRCGELRLKVNRAHSEVVGQLLTEQYLHDLQGTQDGKRKVMELEKQKQALGLLVKMVTGQQTHLSRTAQDIKLLADIIKEQLQRGEIQPPAELTKETPVGDISSMASVLPDLSARTREVYDKEMEARRGATIETLQGKLVSMPTGHLGEFYPVQPVTTALDARPSGNGMALPDFNPFAAQTAPPVPTPAVEVIGNLLTDSTEPEDLSPMPGEVVEKFEDIVTTGESKGPNGQLAQIF